MTGSGPYEAVVFDLDGVICHTDVYHYRGWKSIADELGIPFDETVNNRLRGVSRMDSLDIVLERYDGEPLSDERKAQLAATKNDRYRVMLGDMTPADLDPSVRSTLDELRSRGLKLAIGSSSKNATFILSRIGLGDYFDAVSDGTNISRSKPDPEVFLKAAEFLGVEPERCVIVEDAVAGIEAGEAAGMYTVAIGDAADQGAGDAQIGTFAELADVLSRLDG
ncbi:MAG: beta-phosphoglucomutase [Propionibacteriaceae bacterium]